MISALLAVFIAQDDATPTPAPLKTIIRVQSSAACTALSDNIGSAVNGILVNDRLASQEWALMGQSVTDAQDQPINSASFMGGNSSHTDLDDVRMHELMLDYTHNIEKIDALLNDPKHFPANAADDRDQAVLQARAQLEHVEADSKVHVERAFNRRALERVERSQQSASALHRPGRRIAEGDRADPHDGA